MSDLDVGGPPIASGELPQQNEPIELQVLAGEFRKLTSQLGELRRRETHLLRRIALLELEMQQRGTSPEVEVKSAELEEAQRQIADFADKLKVKSAEAAILEAELARARGQIEELPDKLKAKSAEAAILEAELARAHRRLQELEGELIASTRQLQAVKASTSWRLTSPLRSLSERFPRLASILRRTFGLARQHP